MQHLDYLKWFLIFAWIPTAIIWLFFWRTLKKYSKVYALCVIGTVIVATPWDYWATHSWLWHFSANHTVGIRFLGLPIEEFIFFISETFLYASLALALRALKHKENTDG